MAAKNGPIEAALVGINRRDFEKLGFGAAYVSELLMMMRSLHSARILRVRPDRRKKLNRCQAGASRSSVGMVASVVEHLGRSQRAFARDAPKVGTLQPILEPDSRLRRIQPDTTQRNAAIHPCPEPDLTSIMSAALLEPTLNRKSGQASTLQGRLAASHPADRAFHRRRFHPG